MHDWHAPACRYIRIYVRTTYIYVHMETRVRSRNARGVDETHALLWNNALPWWKVPANTWFQWARLTDWLRPLRKKGTKGSARDFLTSPREKRKLLHFSDGSLSSSPRRWDRSFVSRLENVRWKRCQSRQLVLGDPLTFCCHAIFPRDNKSDDSLFICFKYQESHWYTVRFPTSFGEDFFSQRKCWGIIFEL